MSLRGNGGYIGPRPTGPSTSAASGIWDLRAAERQQRASAWPSPPPPPDAPTSVTATSGNAQVSLSWTAPAEVSGFPTTDYVVQYSSNSGSTWTTFSDGTSTATSATVTGLTNGTAYTFRVAGVNGVGQGAYSAASSSVTPSSLAVPQTIAGLELWLDGSDASTLYDATTGGSLVSGSGAIARWEDKSGNGRHATQSDASKRPTRLAAAANGLPAVNFDGTNDKLFYSGVSQSDATIFAVVRRQSGGSSYQGVFAFAKTYAIYSRMSSGPWGVYNVSASQDNGSDVWLSPNVTYLLTARRTSANRFLYTNGSLSATVAADSFSGYADVIGADADNTQVHNGVICELVAYSSSLSDANRATIESYLMTKWGIS